MSDGNEELAAEAQKFVDLISGIVKDPEAMARTVGAWLRHKFPDRLAEAMWVTVEGDRDKGLEVRIYEKKLERWPRFHARVNALLGVRTVGAGVSADVARLENGATIAVGLGVVSPYRDLGELSPVAVLSVRF